ncbi:Nuclear control of ATPase protein 2 [Psilocybe cubensis]|uniref:Nuclear control of ATPase protein 2 n=2 Tax=Psilocybe cubensis TaxID=181762 RepID=A0ACB8H8D8_PSICU|nr:Nuclear control of ATPase protein 2 [Psilocybe cubensis]KAH9483454.1 Nuclear control of ATPase protein 2 [Psilocybe cubensis]
MPSEFVNHFTRTLEPSTSRPTSPPPSSTFNTKGHKTQTNVVTSSSTSASARKAALHALLLSLNQHTVSLDDIQRSLPTLEGLLKSRTAGVTAESTEVSRVSVPDAEEDALEQAIIGKLTVSLYSDALEIFITQATQVEAEAEWWSDVESSRIQVCLYLLQTLPSRVCNVLRTIITTLRSHQLPMNLSTLSPSSLHALFSTSTLSLRPGVLTTSFFPHLRHQQSLSLSVLLPASSSTYALDHEVSESTNAVYVRLRKSFHRMVHTLTWTFRFFILPLEITRQECRYNQKALERIRDERARVLGELAQLRIPLASLVHSSAGIRVDSLATRKYTTFLDTLARVVSYSASPSSLHASTSAIFPLTTLLQTMPTLNMNHTLYLNDQNLLRPSMLTRIWPRLMVFPAVALYIYSSREAWIPALINMLKDADETVRGFVQGWLVEPLLGVLHTVRVGGKGDVLVSKEGVAADLESLERMTLSLARDALQYTPSQLESLAEQVRLGDLTPVMEIYEEDIRTPLKSAITGTLLRNAFIQVQKAKVDIDQALAGIDRLLKSQELTFAFVGVAPSLAIVWAFFGAAGRLLKTSSGSRYGGRRKRRGVWERLRRIERLLILQPPSGPSVSDTLNSDSPIAPLPTGLLILSLTRLRSYALANLPANIQAAFLEDLGDLEDTQLGREAKLRVVERMWRCWGQGQEAVIRY